MARFPRAGYYPLLPLTIGSNPPKYKSVHQAKTQAWQAVYKFVQSRFLWWGRGFLPTRFGASHPARPPDLGWGVVDLVDRRCSS